MRLILFWGYRYGNNKIVSEKNMQMCLYVFKKYIKNEIFYSSLEALA